MEMKRNIEFTVEKGAKKPISMNISALMFGLYMPNRIKIQSCEIGDLKKNFRVALPTEMFGTIVFLPHLQKDSLVVLYNHHIIGNIKKGSTQII